MPKISVIIPIYKVEKYIERCVRSLFEQTLEDIEYIFINDCTPDNSINILNEIIEEYPKRKKQIQIVETSQNSGQAIVRRLGMSLATGDFIIHCDSDDWIEKNMYNLLYNKAVSENLDFTFCDYYEFNGIERKHICCKSICNKHNILSDLISQRTAVSLWNKLIRRNLCDKLIYPTNNMGEDLAITIQLAINSESFGYIQKPLYFYCYNPNSISNVETKEAFKRRWIDLKTNILLINRCIEINNLADEYKKEICYLKKKCKDLILFQPEFDSESKDMWQNSFNDLDFWAEKGLRNKVRYIFVYFNILPMYKRIDRNIVKIKKRFHTFFN